jgi:hypothetical protein
MRATLPLGDVRLRAFLTALAISVGLASAWLALAANAEAATDINRFNFLPSSTQAGGHPDVAVTFSLGNRTDEDGEGADAKITNVSAPAGYVINPNATPKCSLAQFAMERCPADSQVGLAQLSIFGLDRFIYAPALYNLEPRPDEPGVFGFQIPIFRNPQYITTKPRTGGDFGLDFYSPAIAHLVPLAGFRVLTWGVPADPKNDWMRFRAGSQRQQNAAEGILCNSDKVTESTDDPSTMVYFCGDRAEDGIKKPIPSNSPPIPLLRNPTTCGEPLTSTLRVTSYDKGISEEVRPFPSTTGCDLLSFNPSLAAQPTTTQADTPSGLDIELRVPQPQSAEVPSASEIKSVTVRLPDGFTINPNAADGKVSCSEEEARFGTELAARCPEYAKIGSLEIDSAVLPGPLPGWVYLGDPQPGDRYRIILVADGYGVHVKIAGSIRPDPETGGVLTVFPELPQSPFEEFRMHLFGSERGSFATPTRCGTYEVQTTYVPWDSALPNQSSKQFFSINSGPGGAPCPASPRPFAPQLLAGTADNTAGAYTPFSFDLRRPDGNQNLRALNVKTPPGFSGSIAGIPYCPELSLQQLADPLYAGLRELSAPVCPAASQIGVADSAAGAGTRPLYSSGKVYLAGPYRGAPLSFVVVIPAVSGPYDLGNVVVRTALFIDRSTGQISALTDDLPRIFGGIPLRVRSLLVRLNRPNFTVNPTRCAPYAIEAAVSGEEGGSAALANHFQVANCSNLPFRPKLSLRLTGRTRRVGYPALHATLSAGAGEANIAETVVTMPHALFLENSHIKAPCTRVQYAADQCPASSILGTARAESPLLSDPLEGPVYLRSSSNKLPDMVAALRGQVDLDLVGRVDAVRQRLRASFETVPDVPVSRFTLDLLGGKRGLLVNSENLCKANLKAVAKFAGQNGKAFKRMVAIKPPCGKKARKK